MQPRRCSDAGEALAFAASRVIRCGRANSYESRLGKVTWNEAIDYDSITISAIVIFYSELLYSEHAYHSGPGVASR